VDVVADLPTDTQSPEPMQQANVCSTTQRYWPSPEPYSVPRRAMTGVLGGAVSSTAPKSRCLRPCIFNSRMSVREDDRRDPSDDSGSANRSPP